MPMKPGEKLPESAEGMDGVTKAAILFVALDHDTASRMLSHMPQEAIEERRRLQDRSRIQVDRGEVIEDR